MDAHCHPSTGKVPTIGSHDCGLGHGCRLVGLDNPPVPLPLPSLLSSSLPHCRRQSNVIVNICIGNNLQCLCPVPFQQQWLSSNPCCPMPTTSPHSQPTLPTAVALHLSLHCHLLPHPSCPQVGCCAASCRTTASRLQAPLPLCLLCLLVPLPHIFWRCCLFLCRSGWLLVVARHCCPPPRPRHHHLGSSLTTKVMREDYCCPYCCWSIIIVNCSASAAAAARREARR